MNVTAFAQHPDYFIIQLGYEKHRFSFSPVLENICEFTRNKIIHHPTGLSIQSVHELSTPSTLIIYGQWDSANGLSV